MTYLTVLKWEYGICTAAAGWFLIRYSFTTLWWRMPVGRNLWAFALLNAAAFGLATWSLLAGPKLPAERLLTQLVLGSFAVALIWRCTIFEREHRRTRRGDRDGGSG